MPDRSKNVHWGWTALAWALAAVAVLALSACGGSGEGSGTNAAGDSDAPAEKVGWPVFGRVPQRTHYLAAESRELDPPLREAWSINTHALIEFPPAVADGVAYVVNKYGNAKAVRLRDRRVLWERNTDPSDRGKPTDVTAPVYHQGRVYFAFIDGSLVAVDARTGKTEWTRHLHSHLESSPMAVGGTLYIGSDTTNVIALRADDGRIVWQFNSPAAIKASPSYHDGRVYVADYEGAMFALEADSGKPVWRTNTTKVRPFGEGGFYSSPAIGFGRVFAARDDGTVYALDLRSGRVDWTFPTGSFIYGSPAIAAVPGTPPSVYVGSYDKHFYALDANSGRRRWRFDVGGAVPGTATVIGHTVYTSTFKTDRTYGLDVHSGRKTFEIDQAGYTPVVSDGRRLYLIGYYTLIGLEPKKR